MKKKRESLNFSFINWFLVGIRGLIFFGAIGINYINQKIIIVMSSFFPFQEWKRYASCLVNLITSRIALLTLGYFQLQTSNFKFFSRNQPKIILKSGYIGIATHKNIVDFLYYSYIFNPLFVRLILKLDLKIENGLQVQYIKEVLYAPLNFDEALRCSFKNRGFDPIIVRGDKQLKVIKYRKVSMPTLVNESHEELKGAIFILLPGLKYDEHIKIEDKIADDIFQNQLKYLRSGVGLKIKFDERDVFKHQYKDQIYFILNLMSQFKINRMLIDSITMRNFKSIYSKDNYRTFMEKNFFTLDPNTKFRNISYIQYLEDLDKEEHRYCEASKASKAKINSEND